MLKELEKKADERKTSVRSLNVNFNEHLENYQHPAFDQIISLYAPYKTHGILPFRGSLVDQPAQIMDFFSILESLEHEKLMREQTRQQKQYERELARGK